MKRIFSLALAVIMIFSMCTFCVVAEDTNTEDDSTEEVINYITGPVSLAEPVKFISSTGEGAYMAATSFDTTDLSYKGITAIFDIRGAKADYVLGGVGGACNGCGFEGGNVTIGTTFPMSGNGYHYLTLGAWNINWSSDNPLNVTAFSVSNTNPSRYGKTDLGG